MCRLLGLIGTPPLPVREALQAFYPLCSQGCVGYKMPQGHFDGWGISGFSAQRAVYFERRAESAIESKNFYDQAVERAAKSQTPVLLAHFRKAATGTRDIGNTAPFHWRDWAFAHNGILYNAAELSLQEARPQGRTDSERFGLWLLEQTAGAFDPTAALAETLRNARAKLVFSSLNFLLTDGSALWAYREAGDQRLEKGETFEDREKYYTLFTTRLDRNSIVCSEPLPGASKNWTPLAQRTLTVLRLDGSEPRTINI